MPIRSGIKRHLHSLFMKGNMLRQSLTMTSQELNRLLTVSQGITFTEQWKTDTQAMHPPGPVANQTSENPLRQYFDGVEHGPGIWKWLHYFDVYQRHLQKFVGRDVHIVEVGIYSGGSLPMWHTYFGPQCHIYGIDIEPACTSYASEKTQIFIGDQADRGFWKKFREEVPIIDVLIDDGGHLPQQQIITLEEVLPHLRPGGVYICEDIHEVHNQFAQYICGLANALNAHRYQISPQGDIHVESTGFQQVIHSIHNYPFLTVIEKRDEPMGELAAPRHGTEWQPFL